MRDRQGFIWVGTENGLARYDGYTCKVYREFAQPNNPVVLFIDSKGRFWIGKYATGLSLYDPANDRFVNFLGRRGDSTALHASYVQTINEDESGVVWLATLDEVVWLDLGDAINETDADSVARHIRFRTIPVDGFRDGAAKVERWDDSSIVVASFGGLFVVNRHTGRISRPGLPRVAGFDVETVAMAALFRETPSKLWIGTASDGLYLLDQATGVLTSHRKKTSEDRIQELQQDTRGRLWIATGDGLDLFNPATGAREEYLSSWGAPGKSMWSRLAMDSTGTLWISTASDGLYYLPPASFRFPHYALAGPSGKPMEMGTVDPWYDGSYWIGAEGKVVQIWVEDLKVTRTVDLLHGEKSRFGPAFWTSYNDGKGTLWLGTWGLGLFGFQPQTGRVKNYRPSHQLPGLRSKEDVCRSIVGTAGDTLFIAAHNDKLLSFDTRHGIYSSVPYDVRGQVVHLMKDRWGKIWLSDEMLGLFVFDPSTRREEFLKNNPPSPDSLVTIHPQQTYQDPAGRIWIGSNSVHLWEPETRLFRLVRNDRFADAILVLPLGSDSRGRVWFNYAGKGLSILDPQTETFTNFDYSDGLLYYGTMTVLHDGRVLLGGDNGMTIVHPDSLYTPGRAPPMAISRVSINDSVNVSPERASTSSLRLPYDQNVLEIEFAAIDPGQGHLIEYRYRLEGLEDSWVHPAGRRFVRYPGLAPGNYLFKAMATSTLARWPDQEAVLAITIAPPWWRTWWAYGLYGVFVFAFAFWVYGLRVRQLSLRQRAEHLAEVDRMKSRFFANISHEFRTPLTLILGPIERVRSEVEKESVRADLSMMQRNAHRLLRLINQLLDLSKLEAGAMKLRASRMDIVPLVKGLAYSFETSAGLRQITMEVDTGEKEIYVYCDGDMLEKIISNLLSNAFKFTAEGGRVTVTVREFRVQNSTTPELRNGGVSITVSDTGTGISPEQLKKIFDRFYQMDESQTREHEGSGIGLALVRELVELHRGTIDVKSQVGRGTEFTVRLPLGRSHLKDEEILEAPATPDPVTYRSTASPAEQRIEEAKEDEDSVVAGDQRPILLVVEDNADVRTYIKSFLVSTYQVLEARDGVAGIERALETVPDLVISDVMMPKKDGYEVCRALKLDEKTSHIPVILLTAKAAGENKIEGLATGADDYLVKPFEPKELLARVKNLIEVRRKLRQRFSVPAPLRPGEIAVTSMDNAFLKKLIAVVEERMSNETFTVEELGNRLNMSRVQLHRKVTALTNQSASEFIRYMRLHRAMDLLRENAATVAEIAYSVGFSTPAHFTKCFHELFGTTPSEIMRKER